ncbi:MAG: hypothetical protein ACR2KT_05305 [Methylocella sp.]|nr:MAG: hypothetical protein DLM68_05110 [Hyphomicrobiales bacterium]
MIARYQSSKKGPPRKSRRARLPTSFMAGCFDFEPSEEDWRRIEAAYPFLTHGDRDEISRMATEYLLFAPFESRAPFLDDSMAWLADLEKAADKFWKAGNKRPVTEEKQLAATYARCFVERNIRHWALPRGNEWSVLMGIMTHVVAAFDIAKRELPKEAVAGHVEGQMWDNLICQLTDFSEQRGYPLGASKGIDKSSSDEPSLFIGFVRELQQTFPAECRRHTASDMAIAEAIATARRKRRARRKAKSATGTS